MSDEGWVKLHRQSINNGWLKNSKLWTFWTWCLMKATYKNISQVIGFQQVELEPGQFIFGRKSAAKELNMTERSVRTCVNNLSINKNITIKTTNKYSIISICNWGIYQGDNNQERPAGDQQATNNRPASDHKQEYKNNKNERKNIDTVEFPTEIHLLFDLFCLTLPEALLPKQPIRDTWLETLDKLHRIDGFSYFQITDMIDWFRQDEFWSKNFLTPLKLRRLNKEKQQYAQVFWQKLLDEKFEDGPADSGAETAVEYIKHKMEEWESK